MSATIFLRRSLPSAACAIFFWALLSEVSAGQAPAGQTPANPPAAGQRPPAPATPPAQPAPNAPNAPKPAPPAARPAARTTMVFVHIRNADRRPLPEAHVVVSGAANRD